MMLARCWDLSKGKVLVDAVVFVWCFSGLVLVMLKSAKDRFVERAPVTTCTTMRPIWYGLASK